MFTSVQQRALLEARKHEKDYIMRSAEKYVGKHEKVMGKLAAVINDSLLEDGTKASLLGTSQSYSNGFSALVAETNALAGHVALMRDEVHAMEPMFVALDTAIAERTEYRRAELDTLVDSRELLAQQVAAFAAILAILITWRIGRSVSVTIGKTIAVLREIAEGDGYLTRRIDESSKDEMGELGKFFNIFVKKINVMVMQIRSGSDQIDAGVGQQTSASQELAQSAGEQAASLGQISSALTEIAAQSDESKNGASQAAALAKQSVKTADLGTGEMEQLATAMSEIKDSSNEISAVISVIDQIAFQTNLLALNAAVEAARAGESGKGFAVVAEEVRDLAQRSATAAQDTSRMIEKATERANKGATIADRVGNVLRGITRDTNKVGELLNSIASASCQQATGIGDIGSAIEQLDRTTPSYAGNSEEMAAASEQTSAQATMLRELVGQFRVSE